MKKKYIAIFSFLFVFSLFLGFNTSFNKNKDKPESGEIVPLSGTTKNYTRKQLQNYIVGTALSYENNKLYSDYEQLTMDNSDSIKGVGSKFNWRTFNMNPESVSRAKHFGIDCSSFATSVYLYSLGYDFSDYHKLSGSVYIENFSKKYAKNKLSNFETAYKKNGKGINTAFFAAIGAAYAPGKTTDSIEKGKEYINNKTTNNSIVVYYYEATGKENETKKQKVKDNIKSSLQPGDLLIYRTYNKNKDKTSGHVMVYVGSVIDSYNGFVHATGDDYDFTTDPISIGDDEYSIRYDTYASRMKKIFPDSTYKTTSSITILRPINKFCSDESCAMTTSQSKDTVEKNSLNINAKARYDVARLRVEQYVTNSKITTDNKIGSTKFSTKSLSTHNSVRKGDILEYNIFLHNRSIREFCAGDAVYSDKTSCEKNGHTWKTTAENKARNYENMVITNKIPDNTTYIKNSCSPSNCQYDEKTKTITWKVATLTPNNSKKYTYQVKVGNTNQVINEGMKITTPNKLTLQLSSIKTNVNPSFTKADLTNLHTNINKFKKLVNENKIKYDGTSSSGDKIALDDIKSESISQLGFIRSMYYNTFWIDLDYLTSANVKNAIFHKESNKDYARKTSDDINNDVEKYKNINKMLVKGLYGGRYLRGNDAGDRSGILRVNDLEVGDIVMGYYTSDDTIASSVASYIYLGTDNNESCHYFVRFTKNKGVVLYSKATSELKSGYRIFKELYSQDLFVVLRPTQLYGTTVAYNYNGGTGPYLAYTAYSKYKNLISSPTKENKTLNLVYNQKVGSNYKTSYTGTNTFDGWYSDKELTKKVTNNTNLVSTSYHTLYAKWKTTNITLPNPTIDGYNIEGWYSDANLTKKVASPSSKYSIKNNVTLYAKWQANKYQIKYDSNGGTGTMSNTTHTYDKKSNLKTNSYTKSGYTFVGWSTTKTGKVVYKDNQSIQNLTTGTNTITLYAQWQKNQEYTVEIKVVNGTTTENKKTITKGEKITVTTTSNTGYSNATVNCTNNQSATINGNILTVSNISNNTVCTIIYNANKYSIKYNANGGSGTMTNSIHTYNQESKLLKNSYTKVGYTFKGWSLSTSGDVKYKDETIIKNLTTGTNAINLYAVWEANKYQIKYDSNGGTGTMSNTTHSFDKESSLKTNSYTKNGYTFVGWSTTKNGQVVYQDNEKVKNLTQNTNTITLYAIWKKITNTDITIQVKVENGISSPTSKVITKGQNATFVITPKEGYGNGIVSCTNNQSANLNGNTLTINNINANSTCTVKYSTNEYIVKYNSNGGTGTMNDSSYTYDTEGNLRKNVFTRNGYTFRGWSLTINGDIDFIDESTIKNLTTGTNTINLYAIWEKITYNITYDLNGGVLEEKIDTYDIETNDFILKEPTKSGYEFIGWTSDKQETPQKNLTIKKGTYGNLNYKANWIKGKYTIVYKSDRYGKITGITTETVEYKDNPSGTTKTINNGYYELKWAVNKDVELKDNKTTIKKGSPITEKQIKQIVVKEDLIITAYHYKTKYQITYNGGENGTISGINEEEVAENENLLGTEIKAKIGYIFAYWIANTNVKLSNGKIILANNKITQEEFKNIIATTSVELKAEYTIANYNIIYQSDTNGVISGITKEIIAYQQNPKGTSITSNNGYTFTYWTANKDVTLNDNSVIKKGNIITNEELLKIKTDDHITFTANNSQENLKVFYKALDNIKITGKESEIVKCGSSPNGTEITFEEQDKNIIWQTDRNIILKDGTKIEKNGEITSKQLKEIIVNENLILTAKYGKEIEKTKPTLNLSLLVIGSIILIIIILIIWVLKRKKSN